MSGELESYCRNVAQQAKEASAQLACLSGAVKNAWLLSSAAAIRAQTETLLTANAKDLANAPGFGLTPAAIDRLTLTPKSLEGVAAGLEQVAALNDPVGEIIESNMRPNGLEVQKVRVPLGVVFFIYESRPNVTADAAALCVKSGNAVILRGGKEALHSNQALVNLLQSQALSCGVPERAVQLVETTDRDAVGHFLKMAEYIDLAIPRGGESLIRRVAAEAVMPVMKHFDGNCHVYLHEDADAEMAIQLTINAKCQRMGVCNAAESLLVHAGAASRLLPRVGAALLEKGIEIRGDARTREWIPHAKEACEADYKAEFLGPIISAAVVDSLDQAIRHINHYGSKHTDAIVTRDLKAAREFAQKVDSSAVMINASTRFNDGFEFGLGAEIGISTDKFHARGPCGLNELMSYKYVVYGDGQIRG